MHEKNVVEYLGSCRYHVQIMNAYARSKAKFVVYMCRVCQNDPARDFTLITTFDRGSTANGMAPGVVTEVLPRT